MALWWASLNARGDPNVAAQPGSPEWTTFAPGSAPGVMFMGQADSPNPFMNSTADTVRAECDHWKLFLGG